MELYYVDSNAEKKLQQMADKKKIPLGGAIELLPLCNMDCKMCYVRKTKEEMENEGRMLTCDEWSASIDEAVKEGLLYLLLTGGEPLLYPEFKKLYVEFVKKGIILSVNTNGTLIDEEWARFFSEYGCRRLSITLYGKDDKTYERLCNNKKGFSQVMEACKWLKKYQVPFRLTCSVTPENVEQLEDLFEIAKQFEVPLAAATYMFPGERRGKTAQEQYRLTPEEAAKAMVKRYKLEHPNVDMVLSAKQNLSQLFHGPKPQNEKGFSCHAGHSGFWLTWRGEMLPCGMFEEPRISLLEKSFKECWRYIVETTQNMTFCQECKMCKLKNICQVCPASCHTESGRIDGRPEYVCEMTKAEISILEDIIKSNKIQ